jgi:sterol desaturase/sphingolipid hydroxylase (fatty acid hydroxylase superfamily)
MQIGFWKSRTHNLSKMGMRDLVKAYFAYPTIHAYLILFVLSTTAALWLPNTLPRLAVAALFAGLFYPLAWYVIHRWVLHGQYLYKSPLTAAVWKRIHFDHHQDPHDLRVLFGALYTTLPTILAVTLPIGWLIGGPGAAALAAATGLVTTCFYEFCHCIQHLPFTPKQEWLRRIKRYHLAHHFHSEHGNYGITNYFWDRVFGTFYAEPKGFARSETVFNLGYTGAESGRFPWVARLSGLSPGSPVGRRGRAE